VPDRLYFTESDEANELIASDPFGISPFRSNVIVPFSVPVWAVPLSVGLYFCSLV